MNLLVIDCEYGNEQTAHIPHFIHRSATTFEPLTGEVTQQSNNVVSEVKNINYLGTTAPVTLCGELNSK